MSTSVAHYATDIGVWTDHFRPGLEAMFGGLWFIVLAAAVAGVVGGALHRGPERVLAAAAAVAFLAYATAPTMAGGPDGTPALFPFQIRHGLAAPLLGLLAGAWALGRASRRAQTGAGAAIAFLGLAVLRAGDGQAALPAWALAVATLAVAAAAVVALLPPPRRRLAVAVAAAAALALLGTRYLDGAYLRGDFARAPITQTGAHSQRLVPLFDWARGIRARRIGIVGTLHQYPFYGLTLSNTVEQVGQPLARGGFDEAVPSCRALADLVGAKRFDYVVTVPRFIEFGGYVVPRPEQRWLDAAAGARRVVGRAGVAVHAIDGPLRCPGA